MTNVTPAETVNHTPGPWEPRDSIQGFYVGRAGNETTAVAAVCKVLKRKWTFEAEANARLIAAAPDLLVSLRELVDYCNKVEWPKPCVIDLMLADAERVIAKAEGREP